MFMQNLCADKGLTSLHAFIEGPLGWMMMPDYLLEARIEGLTKINCPGLELTSVVGSQIVHIFCTKSRGTHLYLLHHTSCGRT